ncbi:zinc finger protein ZFAT-like isoform X2 [Patiria miniata]|uniref:C2H2-type domain-containing protein n=1 Tax=Patiria miniata TaxID=46514 RepID=A0A914AY88_PATMI|nr:zinc finger protein ZFAT-like isoform X2 [Patiria miniata]
MPSSRAYVCSQCAKSNACINYLGLKLMNMDTSTSGSCGARFAKLEDYLCHQKPPCNDGQEFNSTELEKSSSLVLGEGDQTIASDENAVIVSTETDTVTLQEALDETEDGLQKQEQSGHNVLPEPETELGTIFICKECNRYTAILADLKKHLLELHNIPLDSEGDILRVLPLNSLVRRKDVDKNSVPREKRKRGRPKKYPGKNVDIPFTKTGQVMLEDSEELAVMMTATTEEKSNIGSGEGAHRTKRGRPRKTEEQREQEKQMMIERIQKELECERSQTSEEKICLTCGREFARARQLKSHRCQGGDPESKSDADGEDDGLATQNIESLCNGGPGMDLPNFDLGKIPERLDLTERTIPQTLNDKALPDLRINKSQALKVYTCPVCRKVYKTKPSLLVHLSTHTKEKPFKCSECSYSSSVKSNLKIHMRKHTNERLHCDVCNYSCISKGNLKKHKSTHGPKQTPIYCRLCSRRAYTHTHLLRHLESEHDIQSDSMAKRYYEEQKLKCRVGQRNLLYQCHVCNRKFKDRRSHDAHVLLHRPTKPFKCALCPYASVRYDAIEVHAKRHWFIYTCHLCRAKVLSVELLKTHLHTHEIPDGSSQDGLLEQSIRTSMYQTDPIEKELVNEHNRRNGLALEGRNEKSPHTENFQGDQANDMGKQTEFLKTEYFKVLSTSAVDSSELQEISEAFAKLNFKKLSLDLLREIHALYGDNECPVCGKLFRYRAQLKVHEKTHEDEKNFKCNLCQYSSHTKQGLKRHVDTVHVGTRLKCPTCDFETTSSTYLLAHRKKQHMDSEVFQCTQCDMSTASEREMKDHIAAHHAELPKSELEKIMGKHIHIRSRSGSVASHRCRLCGEVFRRVCDLRRHLWFHSGTNPYKCRLCRFVARTAQNLQIHMLKHSNARMHLCHHCGKMFKMKSALKAHCMSQHPADKLVSCPHCQFTTNNESLLQRHMGVHVNLPSQTFRCFQCTQYTDSKDTLREHYQQDHPDTPFEESLSYEVPEEKITTLNISINHKDGVLQYKCSQCDVLLVNNGELGQHLRDVHGLAITSIAEGEGGEMDPEQLATGNLTGQADLNGLTQESHTVQLADHAEDESTSAMQLLQHIIDIQKIAEADRAIGDTNQAQPYTAEDNNQGSEHDRIPESITAVNYLTASENLTDTHGDGYTHQSQPNLQVIESCQVIGQPIQHDGSSEDIPVAVFEQEVADGVTLEPEGHITYILSEEQQPS